MVRIGKIHSVDRRSNSGTLIDTTGTEYFFSGPECKDETIPKIGTIVTFVRDTDYKQTPVACLVCECDEVTQAA